MESVKFIVYWRLLTDPCNLATTVLLENKRESVVRRKD
jgi:hypothetical protein